MNQLLFENFPEKELTNLVQHSISAIADKIHIKTAPARNTLADILGAYTKDNLFKLAEANQIEIKKSWKKDLLVETIHTEIMDTLAERIILFDEETISFLPQLATGQIDLEEANPQMAKFFISDYRKLTTFGLLATYVKKDESKFFIAAELLDALERLSEIKAQKHTAITRFQQINHVLAAAINLYGIADTLRITELFEIRYPTIATDKVFSDYLKKCLPILGTMNNYYILINGALASIEFQDELAALEMYIEILNKMRWYYYKPSKAEIEYYSENEFEKDSLPYIQLYNYVKNYSNDPDEVLNIIQLYSALGEDISKPISIINDSQLVNFPSRKTAEQFFNLAIRLHNNSRMWKNGGYTSLEFNQKYRHAVDENGQIDPALVENNTPPIMKPPLSGRRLIKQEPIRVKKIGRNDPCPCGSGKKYKKCCMRKAQ